MLVNVGFDNSVVLENISTIVSIESAPIKRMVAKAREDNMLIDATMGRKAHSVVIMKSKHLVLSSVAPKTINRRAGKND